MGHEDPQVTYAELPDDFVWGTATSAFQIEGARRADGKGDSIWDTFGDQGRVPGVDLPGCDSYHRWEEDLDLLAEAGVKAYRFSVAWPRVMPDGIGPVNEEGVAYYERLISGLRRRDIEPYVTLYHWDLPQALQDRGGWASRETADAFATYAGTVAGRFQGQVANWITHNEPWVASVLGHIEGVFAPGISDWETGLKVAHHMLLSHGMATEAIRDGDSGARVGLALDCRPAFPASSSDADAAATRHFDGFRNRWFFDPVFGRGYPEDMIRSYSDKGRLPRGLEDFVLTGDLDLISTAIDFLGLNYYTTIDVSRGNDESEGSEIEPGPRAAPGHTEMGWRIDAAGLTAYLVHIAETYRPDSILVTENGASYSDGPDGSGVIHDDRRIDYLRQHVAAIEEAREQGAPVDGYFVWSLLDNLEWTQGYSQRFGLVWVDHETSRRVPKESFRWYADLIRTTTQRNSDLDRLRAADPSAETPTRLEQWMDGYVASWTDNHPDHIAALFSADAVYDPQTADGELNGIDEIVAWWRGIDDDPDNWEFEWRPLIETEEIAVITGVTRYIDPPATYRNLFVILFDDDGRCRDFTEWYIEEEG